MIYIFIAIILILLIINSSNKIENYDGRISNISSYANCADICSSVYKCSGFGYDDKEKKCYISQFPIFGQPIAGLYRNEYKTSQQSCNKIRPIQNADGITDETLVMNRIYSCADNAIGNYEMYYFAKGKDPEKIQDPNITIDKIKGNKYNMYDIDFPKTKVDMNISLLSPELNKDNKKQIFIEDTNEHLGQYLYNHKCVANISKKQCMNHCAKNKDCVGFEWNPEISTKKGTYNNICCPKRYIDIVIPRRNKFKNGLYYDKKIINDYEDKPYVDVN
uniref:Apple domain-containing protein n=1 Tax=viral metagenome TaxID=1070528 RepID=A0A6C0EE84_9ZZZZ